MELSTIQCPQSEYQKGYVSKNGSGKARIQNIDKLVQLLRSKVKHTPSEMAVCTGE